MGVCYAKAKNKPPNISNILAQLSTSESRVGARGANQSGQEVKSSDLHSSLDHEGKNSDSKTQQNWIDWKVMPGLLR